MVHDELKLLVRQLVESGQWQGVRLIDHDAHADAEMQEEAMAA